MQFAKRVVLNALTRKQNRNKTPELPQAPIPSPLYHGFSCFSGWAEMRPGPSLCTRPTAFHLLHDNNTPLSLSLVTFISSLSTEMFPLAHKHTINPSHKKKKIKLILTPSAPSKFLCFSLYSSHTSTKTTWNSRQRSLSRVLSSRTQLQPGFHSHPNPIEYALIRLMRTFCCQIPLLTWSDSSV